MVRTSFPPVESLSETVVKEAIPLVEIEGYVAQVYELCRYWVDDDNLVYSATLHMILAEGWCPSLGSVRNCYPRLLGRASVMGR